MKICLEDELFTPQIIKIVPFIIYNDHKLFCSNQLKKYQTEKILGKQTKAYWSFRSYPPRN